MKTLQHIFLAGFIFSMFSLSGQEYDDLYFTKKDRKKPKPVSEDSSRAEESTSSGSSFLSRQRSYTPTGVSEESIKRYKRAGITQYQDEEGGEVVTRSDNEDVYQKDQQVVVNNYYNSSYYDPFRGPAGWGTGLGWNTWNSGLWFSYGWNTWNNPFFGNLGYDPWYGWGGFYPSWQGWGGGFYNTYWCPPYYRGSYYRTPVIASERTLGSRRAVQRGGRHSRGGEISSPGRSRSIGSSPSVANAINDSRDYTQQQAEYLNRSRRSVSISNQYAGGGKTINTRRSPNGATTNRNTSSRSSGNQTRTKRSSVRNNNYSSPSGRTGTRSSRQSSYSSGRRSSSAISPRSSRRSSNTMRRSSGRSSSGRSGSGRSRR